jgi:hypothetical protein
MDFWFYENFKDHKLYQSWQAGINFVEGQIDPKYFNKQFGRVVSFVGFLSPFYYLGDAVVDTNAKQTFAVQVHDRF